MAKPTQTFTWATDPTYTVGPDLGLSTRLAPPAGYAAQGWVPTEEAPARYMNNLLGLTGDWIAYLAALPAETGFVGADFTWGGFHVFNNDVTFNDPVTLTDTVTATGLVQINSPGSLLVNGNANFGGKTVFTGIATYDQTASPKAMFSTLVGVTGLISIGDISSSTNITGTKMQATGIGSAGGYHLTQDSEVYYDFVGGSPFSGRERVVMVPVQNTVLSAGSLAYTNDGGYTTSQNGTTGLLSLDIPRGATLKKVRVCTSNNSGGASSHTVSVVKLTPDKVTFLTTAQAQLASQTVSVASGTSNLFDLALNELQDNTSSLVRITMTTNNGDGVRWAEITYDDPGPRNG